MRTFLLSSFIFFLVAGISVTTADDSSLVTGSLTGGFIDALANLLEALVAIPAAILNTFSAIVRNALSDVQRIANNLRNTLSSIGSRINWDLFLLVLGSNSALSDITTQVQAIVSATNNADAQFKTAIDKIKSEIATATGTKLTNLQNSLQISLEVVASSELAAFQRVADVISRLRSLGKTVDPQILKAFTDLSTLAKTALQAAIDNLNNKIQAQITAKQQVSSVDVLRLMSLRNTLAQLILTETNELAAEANGASADTKSAIKTRLNADLTIINNLIDADQKLSLALNNRYDLLINPQIALDKAVKSKIEAQLSKLP